MNTYEPLPTTALGKLASTLPARSRVGLALIAGALALDYLKPYRNYSIGRYAFDLARRWYDGEAVSPRAMEESLHDESDEGVLVCAQESRSRQDLPAWLVLASALYYTAYQAYRKAGERPGPLVFEVDETELDELDKQLRALSPTAISAVESAAQHLTMWAPRLPFAQLKAKVLSDMGPSDQSP